MTSTSAKSLAAISSAVVSGIGMPDWTRTSPVLSATTSPTAVLPVIALAKALCVCALPFLIVVVG
jgi:hypothetical protein